MQPDNQNSQPMNPNPPTPSLLPPTRQYRQFPQAPVLPWFHYINRFCKQFCNLQLKAPASGTP